MLAPSGHYRENFTRKLRYKKKITLSLHSLPSLHGLHFNMTVRFSFAGGGGGGGGGGGPPRRLALHPSKNFSVF